MRTLRVGIVGAGFAGRFHYESFQHVRGVPVEVVGVTSRTAKSREAYAAKYGVRAFDSLDAMLGEVDVVDICSPPYAHEGNIIAAAKAGKHVICEKPLTGYFGPQAAGKEATEEGGTVPNSGTVPKPGSWRGDRAAKAPMIREVKKSCERIRKAVRKAGVVFGYAENFVYAPAVQKEREIIEKTHAQILRSVGEESHKGSGSPVYGIWRFAGGGSLMGKGCHPLTALLYLKHVEGLASGGKAIRPKAVTSRVHELTRIKGYRDAGFIRTDYHDIEDYGWMHVVFEDGTVADITTGETTLGGVYDYLEIFANNHRARCRINPANLLDVYNPSGKQMQDVYLVEKISSSEGWTPAAPDENWILGYHHELQDFMECIAAGREPICGIDLAADTMVVIYAAYLSAERKGAEVAV